MAEHTVRIGIYQNIQDTKGKEIDLGIFLDQIKNGKWQDLVLPVRAITDHELRQEAKKTIPNVTISGTFTLRKDASIKKHSGFIAIDIDKVPDVEAVRSVVNDDPHTYASFTSISGIGLCVIFTIDGSRHREAFEGIEKYFAEQYSIVIDSSGRNESRARYVSFDPDMYLNEKAARFKKYLPKEKPRKVQPVVFVEDDFSLVIKELSFRNICEDYRDWVSVGYALASEFNEGGRSYFDALSSGSSKYDPAVCDKLYTKLLTTLSTGKEKQSTLGTIYHYARINNIPFYSERTKKILSSVSSLRKSGLKEPEIVKTLQKYDGIPEEESAPIVRQAIENKVVTDSTDNLFTELETWMKYNYEFRRNEITRYIEDRGKILKQKDFNTIFISAKKAIDDVTYEMVERLVNSDFTPDYNPIIEFFASYIDRTSTTSIDELFGTIGTTDPVFAKHFGRKWLVGLIASIHGEHSPLMLILSGSLQNTGKTEWFRRLLPTELRPYYAESKLDAGKDDEILMTQKLLIMDDEMGGKNKKEEKRIKELLSKQTFSLREPYGRNNVDLLRIAVLCATTNDNQILTDPTGNRRMIPIPVISINQSAYNKIDKVDVIMEAYHLWKSGFDWRLTKEEIATLSIHGDQFQSFGVEYELLIRYYQTPDPGHEEYLTATDIKIELERITNQKLSLDRLGKELSRLGYVQLSKRIGGAPKKVYRIQTVPKMVNIPGPFNSV